MKTYIFPTDFSKNAKNALEFAVPFVKKLQGRLLLFHVYEFANPYVEVPAYKFEEMTREIEAKAIQQLSELMRYVKSLDPNLPCSYATKGGSFERNLLDIAEQENCGAILMGTMGASGLKRLLVGTSTASIIANTKFPVLAIPNNVYFAGINSIVFAIDYQERNEFILDQITELARTFDAKIELLYITLENVYVDLDIYDWYQNMIKERSPELDISYRVLNHASVQEGIQSYVKSTEPDLIVMASHKKSWFDRILRGSQSKKIAYTTEKPLLVYKEEIREMVF